MLSEKEFLKYLKLYIEEAETELSDSELNPDIVLERLIEAGDMPPIYDEILQRLVRYSIEKCPNCDAPLRDAYVYTDNSGSYVACPWCQCTWTKADFDDMLARTSKEN